jgi:hypothetical protein
MSKICRREGREVIQVLISFYFGELTLRPFTLREAKVKGRSDMGELNLGGR